MDSANPQMRKRRATRACQICHARRVRCDVDADGPPCTNCRLDQVECASFMSERRQEHPSKRNKLDARISGLDVEIVPSLSPICFPNGSKNRLQAPDNSLPVFPQMDPRANLPKFIRPFAMTVDPVDLEYLKKKGAFCLPEESFQKELLESYFNFVNPFMPLFDKVHIMSKFHGLDYSRNDKEDDPRISLLLLQALLFAGSEFVDMTTVNAMGYETRQLARRTLYLRVKLLYDFEVESDGIALLQSLLLMTYWVELDDQRGPLHWMLAAISHAQAIDLLGTIRTSSPADPRIKLLRRLLWCCFMRETVLAIGLRCPTMMRAEGCEVQPLTVDDFEITEAFQEGSEGVSTTFSTPHYQESERERILVIISIEMAKLCFCINRIFFAQYSAAVSARSESHLASGTAQVTPSTAIAIEIGFCSTQLTTWMRGLSKEACWPQKDEITGTKPDPSLTLHRILLHMTYFTAINDLYRSQVFPSAAEQWLARHTGDKLHKLYRRKAYHAAQETARLAEAVTRHDLVKYMPSYSVSILTPAIVVHLLEIKTCRKPLRTETVHGFTFCMSLLETLKGKHSCADRGMHFLDAALQDIKAGKLATSINLDEFQNQDNTSTAQHSTSEHHQKETTRSFSSAAAKPNLSLPVPSDGSTAFSPDIFSSTSERSIQSSPTYHELASGDFVAISTDILPPDIPQMPLHSFVTNEDGGSGDRIDNADPLYSFNQQPANFFLDIIEDLGPLSGENNGDDIYERGEQALNLSWIDGESLAELFESS